jgi:hypothetical protein
MGSGAGQARCAAASICDKAILYGEDLKKFWVHCRIPDTGSKIHAFLRNGCLLGLPRMHGIRFTHRLLKRLKDLAFSGLKERQRPRNLFIHGEKTWAACLKIIIQDNLQEVC